MLVQDMTHGNSTSNLLRITGKSFNYLIKNSKWFSTAATIAILIIKITISSIVIGLKKLLFSTNSLAELLSDNFFIGQFNKPITFKVVVWINQSHAISFVSLLMQIFPFFHNLAILLFSENAIYWISLRYLIFKICIDLSLNSTVLNPTAGMYVSSCAETL